MGTSVPVTLANWIFNVTMVVRQRVWLNDIFWIFAKQLVHPQIKLPMVDLDIPQTWARLPEVGKWQPVQEVAFLTFTYVQLTSTYNILEPAYLPEHLIRHSNHAGLKLQRYSFRLLLSSHL